jgi:hypothetical protein
MITKIKGRGDGGELTFDPTAPSHSLSHRNKKEHRMSKPIPNDYAKLLTEVKERHPLCAIRRAQGRQQGTRCLVLGCRSNDC